MNKGYTPRKIITPATPLGFC